MSHFLRGKRIQFWPAIGRYLVVEFNTSDFPIGMFDGSFRIEHNHTGANSIFFHEESDAWSGHQQSHQRATGLRLHRQTHRMDATHQGDQCFTECLEGSVVPYAGGHG
jgi:hypothetical protein